MRVLVTVLVVATLFAMASGASTDTKNLHNQTLPLELSALQRQALVGLNTDLLPVQVDTRASLAPVSMLDVVIRSPDHQVKTQGAQQSVRITFFYCVRTVGVPDDGGGYCGTTATGAQVHSPTGNTPGTAACPSQWLGRTFTIVGDEEELVYKCEDTGSLVTGNQVDIWLYTNGEGWFEFPLKGEGAIVWRS